MAVVCPPVVVTLKESWRESVAELFSPLIITLIKMITTPIPIKPITLLCIAVTCLVYFLKTEEASGGLFSLNSPQVL
jgi:hypothetical protein